MVNSTFEVEAYVSEGGIYANPCSLCGETPSIGGISFFLRGRLGTHILVHLCKQDWNDVGILQATAKVLAKTAADISSGVTWKQIQKEVSERTSTKTGFAPV